MLFKANRFMVKEKSIPTIFAGKIIRETQKAMQIAGQGILTKKINGVCCFCGRELTDPNSIKLGIGPICAANHNIPVLEGYTDKDIEKEENEILASVEERTLPDEDDEIIESETDYEKLKEAARNQHEDYDDFRKPQGDLSFRDESVDSELRTEEEFSVPKKEFDLPDEELKDEFIAEENEQELLGDIDSLPEQEKLLEEETEISESTDKSVINEAKNMHAIIV